MREIKFRAIRTDGKGWVFGMPLACESYSSFEGEKPSNLHIANILQDECIKTCLSNGLLSINARTRKADPQTLCQFTGLKDKNGVEIYEGDIAKSTFLHFGVGRDVFGEVKFYEGQYWLDDGESSVGLFSELHDLEVVGNAYENPELLE